MVKNSNRHGSSRELDSNKMNHFSIMDNPEMVAPENILSDQDIEEYSEEELDEDRVPVTASEWQQTNPSTLDSQIKCGSDMQK